MRNELSNTIIDNLKSDSKVDISSSAKSSMNSFWKDNAYTESKRKVEMVLKMVYNIFSQQGTFSVVSGKREKLKGMVPTQGTNSVEGPNVDCVVLSIVTEDTPIKYFDKLIANISSISKWCKSYKKGYNMVNIDICGNSNSSFYMNIVMSEKGFEIEVGRESSPLLERKELNNDK